MLDSFEQIYISMQALFIFSFNLFLPARTCGKSSPMNIYPCSLRSFWWCFIPMPTFAHRSWGAGVYWQPGVSSSCFHCWTITWWLVWFFITSSKSWCFLHLPLIHLSILIFCFWPSVYPILHPMQCQSVPVLMLCPASYSSHSFKKKKTLNFIFCIQIGSRGFSR